jgi:hypothetical protein
MIDDPEDFHVRLKRYSTFKDTELGQLYLKHENALINYWRIDDMTMPPPKS